MNTIESHDTTLKYIPEKLKDLHSIKLKLLGIWIPLDFKFKTTNEGFEEAATCVEAMQAIDRLRAMIEGDFRKRNGLPPTPPPNYEFNYWQ